MKFTKQIKADWLAALKSGKYLQAKGTLVKKEDEGPNGSRAGHCCIAVLGEITPGLDNDPKSEDEGNCPYSFLDKTIGNALTNDLYVTNDTTYNYNKPDYSNVIPLIESLPTED